MGAASPATYAAVARSHALRALLLTIGPSATSTYGRSVLQVVIFSDHGVAERHATFNGIEKYSTLAVL